MLSGFVLPHSKPFYAAARFLRWMRQRGLFCGARGREKRAAILLVVFAAQFCRLPIPPEQTDTHLHEHWNQFNSILVVCFMLQPIYVFLFA